MAYEKLQGKRAIAVYPQDDVTVPAPSGLLFSGTTDSTVTDELADSSAAFNGGGGTMRVTQGATVYNTTDGTSAKVLRVEDTSLVLSDDIFTTGEDYSIYAVDNSEGPVLFVGTAGDLTIKTVGGDIVTLLNIGNASFIPMMVREVRSATTATDIIAIW
jgi:hypothetical protein